MLHPYAILLLEATAAHPAALAGHVCTVLADLVLLGSALVLSVDARATHCGTRANLATVATLMMIQDLPLVVVAVADPGRSGYAYRISDGHLLTVLVVAALVLIGCRPGRPPQRNPLLTGLLLGTVVLAVRSLLLVIDPTPFLRPGSLLDGLLLALIALLTAVVCIATMRSDLPRAASARITLGVGAYFLARLWASAIEASSPPVVSVVGVVVASALLATTSIALLLESLRRQEAHGHHLQQRAAVAEATVRHDREVVHEVRSATAGIVAGAHLLASGRVPPGPRRVALQQMVDAEAARLDRRMTQHVAEEITEVDVDELIEPLVLAQGAQGHQVDWSRSGHRVIGRHDAVSEIVNVLLANAARHAGGKGTAIDVTATDADIEIRVSDRGPGVAPDVEDRLFQWEARSESSPGEGIGLQRAQRLAHELGGQLRHDRRAGRRGAAFIVTLRIADQAPAPPLHEPFGLAG
ncbi:MULTISPECIES: sensor histidine kinase [unclassified Nocardioides]|uniref:sensor histidine kinase n=1 Tax=unclassified Nocardioides TaxID=2615069 RepID=UPI000703B604|nr:MULTISPECIES: sensor histidine kinase [unclassified Nocardioides]KRC48865.1 hypothetical protein ASE19_18275 [Nocardioides sp. Root79]KRC75264.1 hypothetical protein ASE20_20175 [Nocardioides sp. Root240]